MLPIPDSLQMRLVVVLVHFLWQGALIAALLAGTVSILRVRSPRVRYAASLLSLLLMAACPVVTWCWLPIVTPTEVFTKATSAGATGGGFGPPVQSVNYGTDGRSPPTDDPAIGHPDVTAAGLRRSPLAVVNDGVGVPASLSSLNEATGGPKLPPVAPNPVTSPFVKGGISLLEAAANRPPAWWQPVAPWIVTAWLIGVALLSLRLLIGTVGTWRWRFDVEPLPSSLGVMVKQLCGLLGMRVPRVTLSSRVTEAVAIGLLRPLILLPVSWATSIPPDMLEGVLAHELAHIRRHDLWVNLLQGIVETVLFYHPAVWWLSSRLRHERELCCDELAVSVTRDQVRYAEMLEHVGRMKLRPRPSPVAVSITGPRHALLERVRHILRPGSIDDPRGSSLVAAMLLALAVLGGALLTSREMLSAGEWSWKKMQQSSIGQDRHHALFLHNGRQPAFVVVRLDPPGTDSSSNGLRSTGNNRGGSFTHKNFTISFEATRNNQPLETLTINGKSFSLGEGRVLVMGDKYKVIQLPVHEPEMVTEANLKQFVQDAVDHAEKHANGDEPQTTGATGGGSEPPVRSSRGDENTGGPKPLPVAPDVEPPAPSNDTRPDNLVEAAGTYRGRVVTEDGSPLPLNLKLMRRVSSEQTRETPIDPKGEFSFGTDPKHGSVRFSMTTAGFAPFDSNWIKLDQPLTLKLSRGAMVKLRLIPPAGSEPVTGTAALIVPWWDEDEQGTFPVDANGIVTIPRCPKATVKIDVLVPGFEEVRVHRWVRGDVTLDVPLQPAGPTRLRIVSAKDGSPIAGAKVRLFSRTRAGSFLTPFQHHGDGPVWGESNADGRVELTTLRAVDPVQTNDPGAAVYAFRIDAPNHAPCYIGDVRAGSDLGEIQVGDSLEVRGEVVRDAAKPERISLQVRQPTVAHGGGDGRGGWKNIEPTEVAGKLTFHLKGMKAGPFDMFIVYSDASEPPNSPRGTIKQLQFHGLLTGSSSNLVITRESVVPGDKLLTVRRASLFPIDDHPPSNVPGHVVKQLAGGLLMVSEEDGVTVLTDNRPPRQPLFVWSSTSPMRHSMGRVDWRVFVLQDGTVFIPGGMNNEAGTHHKLPAAELQELKSLLEKHRELFGRQVPKELPQFAGWRHGHENLSYTKEGETKAFVKWYGLEEQPPVVGEFVFDTAGTHKEIIDFVIRLKTDAACGGREARAKYRELANQALTAALPQATPFRVTPFQESDWTNAVNGTDGTRTIRFANATERTEVTLVHPAFGEVYVERVEHLGKRVAFDPQLLGVQGKVDASFAPARETDAKQVANQRVRAALQEITEIHFNETPLTDALTYLSDLHNIPVELDATAVLALKESDTKLVTLDLRGDELSAALMLLLHPFDLSYLAEGDRLVIATPDEVRRRGAAVPQTLRQVLNSLTTHPGIRWEAILLGKIEAGDFEVVPKIVTALSDKDVVVQRAAAEALYRLAEGAISAIPALETLSRSGDARVRFAAYRALSAIGREDLRTLPWLVEAWSRDPVVRDRWMSLVREYSDRVFDEFAKLYPNANLEFRKALLIAAHGREKLAEQLILLGLTDTDDKLRHAALRSMVRSRPTDAQLPALRTLLQDVHPLSRVFAAELLLPFEGDSAAARDVLLKAIADGPDFGRNAAVGTFMQQRPDVSVRLIGELNELLKNGPEAQRRGAWIALTAMQVQSVRVGGDQTWGPTTDGIRTRISLLTETPTLGRTIKLRLEVSNVGREDRTYDDRADAVDGALKIVGRAAAELPDVAISFPTKGIAKTLPPGGILVCEVELDPAKQLRLPKVGQFGFQFRGKSLPPSNVLMADVGAAAAERGQETRAGDAPDPDQARRTSAVERGVQFLKSRQRDDDGTWFEDGSKVEGVTALATVALLQAGVKTDEAVIQKALPTLRKIEPKMIYVVALQTMALCIASPKDDAALIRRNVEWIENAQVKEGDATGGWSYVGTPTRWADGSCSRFAVLGLDAAKRAKFEVRAETWQRVATYWLKSQKENGCWGYVPESPPTFSMSLAGIAGLATAHRHLPKDAQAAAREAAMHKPHEFIAKSIPSIASSWPFYSFHCLERAGHLTNTVRFGDVDWKSVVTKRLLDHQRHDGAWTGPNASENELIATSFALMFLSSRPEAPVEGKADGAARLDGEKPSGPTTTDKPLGPDQREMRIKPRGGKGATFTVVTHTTQDVPPLQQTVLDGGIEIEVAEGNGARLRLQADRAIILVEANDQTNLLDGRSPVASLLKLELVGKVTLEYVRQPSAAPIKLQAERLSVDLAKHHVKGEKISLIREGGSPTIDWDEFDLPTGPPAKMPLPKEGPPGATGGSSEPPVPSTAESKNTGSPKPLPVAPGSEQAGPLPGQTKHGVQLCIRGRVMIDGPIPKVPPIKGPFVRGAMPRRNANGETIQPPGAVIAGTEGEFPDDTLVISKEGGLANVAIYLKKVPKDWKPTAPPTEPVVIEATNYRFSPHMSFIRAGQSLMFKNSLDEAANFHSLPIRATEQNVAINSRSEKLIKTPYTQSERLPNHFGSGVHPWMKGYLLALDHPFAAITDADGRFEIRDLPPGEHHCTVWHERRGYLNKDLVVLVEEGKVTEVDLKYMAEQFEQREGATASARQTGVSALPEHSNPAVVKLLNEYKEYFAKQRFAEAEIAAKQAKELDPDNPQIARLLKVARYARRLATGDIKPPVASPFTLESVERMMKRGERLAANDREAAAKLVGRWVLTVSERHVYQAAITQADDGTLLLTGVPKPVVLWGRFAQIGERLELVEPNDQQIDDFIWQVRSLNKLSLVVSKSSINADYTGATLERLADAE